MAAARSRRTPVSGDINHAHRCHVASSFVFFVSSVVDCLSSPENPLGRRTRAMKNLPPVWSALHRFLAGNSAVMTKNLCARQSDARVELLEQRIAPANAFGVSNTGNLIRFDLASPGTIVSAAPITGLAAGETILGIDFRPLTGELYALGSTSRLYVLDYIDTSSAVQATPVGNADAFTLNGTAFGFDFNPTVDRIRVVSNANQDLRLNPNDGTLAATDTALAYPAGDVNAGANPDVAGSAYTNSVAGATTTTLYGIDVARSPDALVTQNPPNAGVLNTVGSLGVNATAVLGFDIAPGTNSAFATLIVGGVSSLYQINLTTGAATLVGGISGGTSLTAFAIAPDGFANTTLVGTTATFNGGTASETIVFDQSGGLLRHNRFSAGDAGFNSDFDFAPTTPGDQTLSATDPAVTIIVNGGGGDDSVLVGSPSTPASGLASTFQINGQGGGDTLTINDTADNTARNITIAGATSTISGVGGLKTFGTIENVIVNAGAGGDTINVTGTSAARTSINAGDGSDTVVFANGASLRGGLVDGGAGTDTLDYSAYVTSVSVDLSAAAAQTLFFATLSAAQEPGPLSSSTGSGLILGTLNAAQTEFTFEVSYQGLQGAPISGTHFHNQIAGVNGPIVRGLFPSEQNGLVSPSGTFSGIWSSSDPTLDPPASDAPIRPLIAPSPVTPGSSLVQELLADRIYFNVHTLPNFPSGEIRGQLLSQGNVSPATGTGGVRNFDNVTGGSSNDTLVGNANVNVLRGGANADTLIGGPGGDQIFGDAGNDLLIWNNGDGSDLMEGGTESDTVQVNGSPTAGDQFLLQVNPADAARLRFDRTNLGLFNLNIGTTEALDFNTLGGDDTATIDFAGGNPIPANGIDFDGGGLDLDRLVLQRSAGTFSATTEGYTTAAGFSAGTITVDGALVAYSEVAAIDDTVPATNFTFTSPSVAERIHVTDGPIVSGAATTQIASATGTFALCNIANKTNVTINASGEAERVVINHPTTPAGVSSLTVNLGGGDDRIELAAVAIPTIALNGSDGSELFFIAPQPNATIAIDGGNPTETPGDVLEYHFARGNPPEVGESAITGEDVMPVNFTGIEEVFTTDATINGLQQLNAKTIIYHDVDGDLVKIKANRPLDSAHFIATGSTLEGTQLQTINFANNEDVTNINLSITAKRDPARGGDSFVNVGFLDATANTLGKIRIKGDLGRIVAGSDAETSAVKSLAVQSLGFFGTTTQDPGSIPSNASVITGSIKTVTVLGNAAGATLSATRFGVIRIGGDLIDSSLRAAGVIDPASKSAALALKSISVGGDVVRSEILAGYDSSGVATNADVQIGAVQVGGNWIASDLAAGVQAGADADFGTNDDGVITTPPGNDIVARIASISIRGFIMGETVPGLGRFGFVAEEIARMQIGTARVALERGPGNDNLDATGPLLIFGQLRDVAVKEVTA
jgi:hypothetical protein